MAAELGEIAPHSYIGQPLAVDIELAALSPEEVAQGLQVRLALADVYRGANVIMNPALATVKLSVEKRGGRSVLHVSTTRPVEADYVHLYVEMGVPGKQEVRLATVWLQHDPNPPPPVVVAPPAGALTAAPAEQVAAQARAARMEAAAKAAKPAVAAGGVGGAAVGAGAAGNGAEGVAVTGRDRSKPAPLPSVHEAETGVIGEVKAAQPRRIAGVLVSADGKPIKPSLKDDAAELPVQVAQALMPLAPLPLPKGVKRPASAPASCPAGGITAKECVALDGHNTEIAGKLSELEAKLKSLQGALGGTAVAKTAVAGHGGAVTPAASAPAPAAPVPVAPGHAAVAEKNPSETMTAPGESAAHGAKSETGASAPSAAAAAASASAEASAAASAPPTKQVRVLPKLKYKKEKPVEQPTDYTLPLAAGGVGLLALLGAGFIWWRSKKNAGKGPLQIWQGFRKKKAPTEEAPAVEPVPAPESVAQ